MLYARTGRPSIAPEKLLRALLLQVLYTVRSERLLDGTLLEAWAGLKSFTRKGDRPAAPPDDPGNPTVNFHGETRRNATHASTTDPEARLYTKAPGQTAKLSYMGHLLMENRHGLAVKAHVIPATGTAERDAALALVATLPGAGRKTVGADKAYDAAAFVAALRAHAVTPHVAQSTTGRTSAIDARTTRHPGYAESQRRRKRIEEIFGWLKTVGLMRKVRHRGVRRVGWMFVFATAVYNLIRIRTLVEARA